MSEIPNSIKNALTKQQDRIYLLHLEKDVLHFMKTKLIAETITTTATTTPQYVIQAQYLKNSYYRLLSHQLCQYYNLQHWNNTSNEIIVTPTVSFNYKELMDKIDSHQFIKICDIAHQYSSSAIHSPSTIQPQLIPQHQQQKPHSSIALKANTGTSSQTSTTATTPEPQIKPKLIIKKIIKPSTPDSELSEGGKDLDVSKSISDGTAASTPTSDNGSEQSSNIESQRASKEALYMKLRQEIFQNNDDDDEEDDEEEEEDKDEEVLDTQVKHQEYRNAYKYRPTYTVNSYNTSPYSQPVPMQIPMHMAQGVLPQFQPVYPNGAPPRTPTGAAPIPTPAPPAMVYSPYYSTPSMIPPGAPSYPYISPVYGGSAGGANPPKYDKETERRLLNNPYIILPDDTKPNYKHKNKRYFNNGGNNNRGDQQQSYGGSSGSNRYKGDDCGQLQQQQQQ